MELYIEKDFLDNFYIDFDESQINKIAKKVITEYGNKRVFINYKIDEFEKLEDENEIFALISNTLPPIPVADIKTHLFEQSDFKQTLIFMNENEDWFEEAEKEGALCFSFDNYREKIEKIIDKLHYKIDLSIKFPGWENLLNVFKFINFNKVVITDGYILTVDHENKIESDIIKILQVLNDENYSCNIEILTKELNSPINNETRHIKEKAKKRYKYLKKQFSNKKMDFRILMYYNNDSYDFHDRTIESNFTLMDCGKGFRLEKNKKISNSQIISETIFEKYTYDRLKSHKNLRKKYFEKLAGRTLLLTNKDRRKYEEDFFIMYP